MIQITDAASAHLAELVASEGAGKDGLRIRVEKGGCAGLQYNMLLDKRLESDAVVVSGTVAVLVDEESQSFLRGSVLDYCDDLTGTGFRISNPNAARSCGCGTSFEPADEHR
jgi:iron-sulfur cluster assembly accessory protein